MEQGSMSDLRQRLTEIQGELKVNLAQTKEYVAMSSLAEALSEVFKFIDELATAIEDLERRSRTGG